MSGCLVREGAQDMVAEAAANSTLFQVPSPVLSLPVPPVSEKFLPLVAPRRCLHGTKALSSPGAGNVLYGTFATPRASGKCLLLALEPTGLSLEKKDKRVVKEDRGDYAKPTCPDLTSKICAHKQSFAGLHCYCTSGYTFPSVLQCSPKLWLDASQLFQDMHLHLGPPFVTCDWLPVTTPRLG